MWTMALVSLRPCDVSGYTYTFISILHLAYGTHSLRGLFKLEQFDVRFNCSLFPNKYLLWWRWCATKQRDEFLSPGLSSAICMEDECVWFGERNRRMPFSFFKLYDWHWHGVFVSLCVNRLRSTSKRKGDPPTSTRQYC